MDEISFQFILFLELEQIESKYRKFHLCDLKTDGLNSRSAYINSPSVRQCLKSVYSQSHDAEAESVVQSTVVPSEIDGGATRMRQKRDFRIKTPSCIQSTIVPSEIDGGATRMQRRGLKIAPPSEITNGNAPKQVSKISNRKVTPNYVNGSGNTVKCQMPPMPAGHEPDMDNFRKYNS